MSSMLLPGRPPLTRARPSSMTSSSPTSSATQRVAKAPAALPLAGLAAAAAAAWLAARVLPGDEDNNEPSSRECPTCGGSGTVTCTCTRWSDASSSDSTPGCGSCGGSLRQACHHCGGGGRAVPLARRVHVERSAGPYDRR